MKLRAATFGRQEKKSGTGRKSICVFEYIIDRCFITQANRNKEACNLVSTNWIQSLSINTEWVNSVLTAKLRLYNMRTQWVCFTAQCDYFLNNYNSLSFCLHVIPVVLNIWIDVEFKRLILNWLGFCGLFPSSVFICRLWDKLLNSLPDSLHGFRILSIHLHV